MKKHDQFSESLCQNMYQLQQAGVLCDIQVDITGSDAPIDLHSIVLAGSCRKFREDLLKNDNDEASIFTVLGNLEKDSLMELVRFLYTGSINLELCNIDKLRYCCVSLQLQEALELIDQHTHQYIDSSSTSSKDTELGNSDESNGVTDLNQTEAVLKSEMDQDMGRSTDQGKGSEANSNNEVEIERTEITTTNTSSESLSGQNKTVNGDNALSFKGVLQQGSNSETGLSNKDLVKRSQTLSNDSIKSSNDVIEHEHESSLSIETDEKNTLDNDNIKNSDVGTCRSNKELAEHEQTDSNNTSLDEKLSSEQLPEQTTSDNENTNLDCKISNEPTDSNSSSVNDKFKDNALPLPSTSGLDQLNNNMDEHGLSEEEQELKGKDVEEEVRFSVSSVGGRGNATKAEMGVQYNKTVEKGSQVQLEEIATVGPGTQKPVLTDSTTQTDENLPRIKHVTLNIISKKNATPKQATQETPHADVINIDDDENGRQEQRMDTGTPHNSNHSNKTNSYNSVISNLSKNSFFNRSDGTKFSKNNAGSMVNSLEKICYSRVVLKSPELPRNPNALSPPRFILSPVTLRQQQPFNVQKLPQATILSPASSPQLPSNKVTSSWNNNENNREVAETTATPKLPCEPAVTKEPPATNAIPTPTPIQLFRNGGQIINSPSALKLSPTSQLKNLTPRVLLNPVKVNENGTAIVNSVEDGKREPSPPSYIVIKPLNDAGEPHNYGHVTSTSDVLSKVSTRTKILPGTRKVANDVNHLSSSTRKLINPDEALKGKTEKKKTSGPRISNVFSLYDFPSGKRFDDSQGQKDKQVTTSQGEGSKRAFDFQTCLVDKGTERVVEITSDEENCLPDTSEPVTSQSHRPLPKRARKRPKKYDDMITFQDNDSTVTSAEEDHVYLNETQDALEIAKTSASDDDDGVDNEQNDSQKQTFNRVNRKKLSRSDRDAMLAKNSRFRKAGINYVSDSSDGDNKKKSKALLRKTPKRKAFICKKAVSNRILERDDDESNRTDQNREIAADTAVEVKQEPKCEEEKNGENKLYEASTGFVDLTLKSEKSESDLEKGDSKELAKVDNINNNSGSNNTNKPETENSSNNKSSSFNKSIRLPSLKEIRSKLNCVKRIDDCTKNQDLQNRKYPVVRYVIKKAGQNYVQKPATPVYVSTDPKPAKPVYQPATPVYVGSDPALKGMLSDSQENRLTNNVVTLSLDSLKNYKNVKPDSLGSYSVSSCTIRNVTGASTKNSGTAANTGIIKNSIGEASICISSDDDKPAEEQPQHQRSLKRLQKVVYIQTPTNEKQAIREGDPKLEEARKKLITIFKQASEKIKEMNKGSKDSQTGGSNNTSGRSSDVDLRVEPPRVRKELPECSGHLDEEVSFSFENIDPKFNHTPEKIQPSTTSETGHDKSRNEICDESCNKMSASLLTEDIDDLSDCVDHSIDDVNCENNEEEDGDNNHRGEGQSEGQSGNEGATNEGSAENDKNDDTGNDSNKENNSGDNSGDKGDQGGDKGDQGGDNTGENEGDNNSGDDGNNDKNGKNNDKDGKKDGKKDENDEDDKSEGKGDKNGKTKDKKVKNSRRKNKNVDETDDTDAGGNTTSEEIKEIRIIRGEEEKENVLTENTCESDSYAVPEEIVMAAPRKNLMGRRSRRSLQSPVIEKNTEIRSAGKQRTRRSTQGSEMSDNRGLSGYDTADSTDSARSASRESRRSVKRPWRFSNEFVQPSPKRNKSPAGVGTSPPSQKKRKPSTDEPVKDLTPTKDSATDTPNSDKKKAKMKFTGRGRPPKPKIEYIIINRFRSYNMIHFGHLFMNQPEVVLTDMKTVPDLKQALTEHPEPFKLSEEFIKNLPPLKPPQDPNKPVLTKGKRGRPKGKKKADENTDANNYLEKQGNLSEDSGETLIECNHTVIDGSAKKPVKRKIKKEKSTNDHRKVQRIEIDLQKLKKVGTGRKRMTKEEEEEFLLSVAQHEEEYDVGLRLIVDLNYTLPKAATVANVDPAKLKLYVKKKQEEGSVNRIVFRTRDRSQRFFCRCGKEYPTNHSLLVHLDRKSCEYGGDAVFKTCGKCRAPSWDEETFMEHNEEEHWVSRVIYKCDFCDYQLRSMKLMAYHMKYEHDIPLKEQRKKESVFSCSYKGCNYETLYDGALVLHNRSHSQKLFRCWKCDQKFETYYEWVDHRKSHKGVVVSKCPDCGETFKDTGLWKEHIVFEHGKDILASISKITDEDRYVPSDTMFKCDQCTGFTTKSRHILAVHNYMEHRGGASAPRPTQQVKLDIGGKPKETYPQWQCDICGLYEGTSAVTLATHKYREHGEDFDFKKHQIYPCAYCSFTCQNASVSRHHVDSHVTSSNALRCKNCNRWFLHEEDYSQHISTHIRGKRISCMYSWCNFNCVLEDNLEKHLIIRHPQQFEGDDSWPLLERSPSDPDAVAQMAMDVLGETGLDIITTPKQPDTRPDQHKHSHSKKHKKKSPFKPSGRKPGQHVIADTNLITPEKSAFKSKKNESASLFSTWDTLLVGDSSGTEMLVESANTTPAKSMNVIDPDEDLFQSLQDSVSAGFSMEVESSDQNEAAEGEGGVDSGIIKRILDLNKDIYEMGGNVSDMEGMMNDNEEVGDNTRIVSDISVAMGDNKEVSVNSFSAADLGVCSIDINDLDTSQIQFVSTDHNLVTLDDSLEKNNVSVVSFGDKDMTLTSDISWTPVQDIASEEDVTINDISATVMPSGQIVILNDLPVKENI